MGRASLTFDVPAVLSRWVGYGQYSFIGGFCLDFGCFIYFFFFFVTKSCIPGGLTAKSALHYYMTHMSCLYKSPAFLMS